MNKLWISIRYEQLKRLMPAIAFFMQSITLSGVIYGLISWRGYEWYYFVIIFLIMICFGISFAWLYYDIMKMKDAEQEAQWIMNPQNINVLSPKERWFYDTLAQAICGDEIAIDKLIVAAHKGRIEENEFEL